jgi:membrane-associated protease RseP (regulator of RpoE activity)
MVMLMSKAADQYPEFEAYLRADLPQVTTRLKVMKAWSKWSALGDGTVLFLRYGRSPEINVDQDGMIGCTYQNQDTKWRLMGFKYAITDPRGTIFLARELVQAVQDARVRGRLGASNPDDKLFLEIAEVTIMHEMIHWSYIGNGIDEEKKYGGNIEYGTTRFETEAYGRPMALPLQKWKCFVRPYVGIAKDLDGTITDVDPGSPAEKVGLLKGDRLSKLDGKPLPRDSAGTEFSTLIAQKMPGDQITIEIVRKGTGLMTLRLTLAAL